MQSTQAKYTMTSEVKTYQRVLWWAIFLVRKGFYFHFKDRRESHNFVTVKRKQDFLTFSPTWIKTSPTDIQIKQLVFVSASTSSAACISSSPLRPPSPLKLLFKSQYMYEFLCLRSPVYLPPLRTFSWWDGASPCYSSFTRSLLGIFPFYLLINTSSSGAPVAAQGAILRFPCCLQPPSRLPHLRFRTCLAC